MSGGAASAKGRRMTHLRRPETARGLLAAACALAAIASCGDAETAPAPPPEPAPTAPVEPPAPETRALPGSLAWAAEGPWRLESERARDEAMRRVEASELFGLDTAASVLELGPGAGAWTSLLAPTVALREGRYVAAVMPAGASEAARALAERFKERFADESLFGRIETVELGAGSPPLAAPGSIEAALTVDDVATWMALGYAEKAFADIADALAPGGRLGVIAPRAAARGAQDPGAPTGYVQQAYVVRLAEEAGLELEGAWELLANPADDREHPFGVWTLAPYRLTAPLGEPANPAFDRSAFDRIGEPDRMTLLFRRPRPEG